jgi:hypothetical protein
MPVLGCAALLAPKRVLPKPAALDAGAPPKLNALPVVAALLLAPKKLPVAAGAPKAGVEVGVPKAPGVLAAGVPKAPGVLAPNRDSVLLAPKAGVEVAAPNAGVELAPKRVLPELAAAKAGVLLAPKAGALGAPKGDEAAGAPKLNPPLAGCAAAEAEGKAVDVIRWTESPRLLWQCCGVAWAAHRAKRHG